MSNNANDKKGTRTVKKSSRVVPDKQSLTLAPRGGPSSGAMGAGPDATTIDRRTASKTHTDLEAIPLRPETVTPTPPTPTTAELKAAGAPKAAIKATKVRPPKPLVAKLTEPAPPLSLLEDRVRELIALQGEHPDQDLIGDVIMILAGALRELRYAFNVFRPFQNQRKITVFGSARTPPDAGEYIQARKFSEEMVRRKFMIITGAGGGIMEAAQGGAGREYSFGVNIKLPFEQSANPFIEGDKKLINFRYFFTRKLCFIREASAIALFPGPDRQGGDRAGGLHRQARRRILA
jgi:hypothetical protein